MEEKKTYPTAFQCDGRWYFNIVCLNSLQNDRFLVPVWQYSKITQVELQPLEKKKGGFWKALLEIPPAIPRSWYAKSIRGSHLTGSRTWELCAKAVVRS